MSKKTAISVVDGRLNYGAFRIICLGDCMKTHHIKLESIDAKTMVSCPECDSDLILVEEDKPEEAQVVNA